MIFVDTNIFMYAAGREHPNKAPSLRFLEATVRNKTETAVNTEILQEILYRYWAIRRAAEGFELYGYARKFCRWIFPVTTEETDLARDLMCEAHRIGPRDALHAATMIKNRIAVIASYDRHFDSVPKIKRLEPD